MYNINQKSPSPISPRLKLQGNDKLNSREVNQERNIEGAQYDIKSYEILAGASDIQRIFCIEQIKKIENYISSKDVFDIERKNAEKEKTFLLDLIKNIEVLLRNVKLYCQFPEHWDTGKMLISEHCYQLILFIDKKCESLSQTMETIVNLLNNTKYRKSKKVDETREILQEFYIHGLYDPLLQILCDRVSKNITILENFQKRYFSYIILNCEHCEVLAKIALSWGEEKLAVNLFRTATAYYLNDSIEYTEIIKRIWDILDAHKTKVSFDDKTDKELVEYYEEINEIMFGNEESTDIDYQILSSEEENQYNDMDLSNNGPGLERTVSCYNWEQLSGT